MQVISYGNALKKQEHPTSVPLGSRQGINLHGKARDSQE